MVEVEAKRNFMANHLQHLYNSMLENKYTDGLFVAQNRSYVVHMVVLSACSDFFIKNQYNLSAVFSDFDDIVIDAILKYCYTGKTTIDEEHYAKFLQLADKLQIKSFAPRYKTIDETNCLEVLRLSDNPKFIEKAMDLVHKNFETLYKTSDFLNLPALILKDLLKLDDLNISSEEDIFNAIKLWVNYDNTNRRSELSELLSFVKLDLLSMEFIVTDCVDFFSFYPECIEILKLAIQPILNNYQCLIQKESLTRKCEKIALIGARNIEVGNTIDIYDGRSKNWTLSKKFGFNRCFFTSVLFNDWILIIGGNTSAKIGVTSVSYIDLKDGKEHTLSPMNQERSWFPAVTVHRNSSTDIYAIGGRVNDTFLSSVERWNSKTNIWDTNVAPMLQASLVHNASVIDGNIYVTGGRIMKDGKHKTINELQVYSVKSNSWCYRTPMLQARDCHSSIVIKGRLYVAGGNFIDTNTFLDSVESYDPNANLWTPFCKLPKPVFGIAFCFYRNKFHCMGGNNGQDNKNTWEYDDVHKQWKPLNNLNVGRSESFAFVIPHNSII